MKVFYAIIIGILAILISACRNVPLNYTHLYDYTAAIALAESSLLDYFIEVNYDNHEILTTNRSLNFGPLYMTESELDFTNLVGIVLVQFEVDVIIDSKDIKERIYYGVVMIDSKGELEVWDEGTHIDNVDKINSYVLDIFK